MIKKASEILSLFIEEEKKKLEGIPMPHMPTLGSAYEEIMKQGIDNEFVIPKSLDLRVVKGFIKSEEVYLPAQVDCMLVVGDGTRYGITDQFFYDINQVLCIFEVKKTLSKSEISSAIDHIGTINREFTRLFCEKLKNKSFSPNISGARKSFAEITGSIAPASYPEIDYLPQSEAILFHSLIQEQHMPVSIIHSYNGYTTEAGLRAAFVETIDQRTKSNKFGLGIPSLPTLITSQNFCLVKCNGFPYMAITPEKKWVAFCSTRYNSARIILELVWAKISRHFNTELPYGMDLDLETLAPLFSAEHHEFDGQSGWAYFAEEYRDSSLKRIEYNGWKPSKIGPSEISAIETMIVNGGYLRLDSKLVNITTNEYGETHEQVVEKLLRTGIFAREDEYLRPILPSTHILLLGDNLGYISNDRDRFDAWCQKNSIDPIYTNLIFME